MPFRPPEYAAMFESPTEEARGLMEKMLWLTIQTGRPFKLRFPGPRDWSPRVRDGQRQLYYFQSFIPRPWIVSFSEIQEKCAIREIAPLVEKGLGFVCRVKDHLEFVYVDHENGRLIMSAFMEEAFRKMKEGPFGF